MKSYIYKDATGIEHTLKVGNHFQDANGFQWTIICCGPKRVKAVCVAHPEIGPTYTAHWCFIENSMKRGMLTNRLTA